MFWHFFVFEFVLAKNISANFDKMQISVVEIS